MSRATICSEADDRTAVVMLYLETFGSPAISAHPASSSIATAVGVVRRCHRQ